MAAPVERRSKALVLGDDTQSFLATVRSLGRQGIEVHAAPFNFSSPSLTSRFISRIHYLPYYLQDGAEWLAAAEKLLRTEKFDLAIPCDERSLLPLHRHRNVLQPLCRLALPADDALAIFFDKHETRELARSLGIPVAPGRLIGSGDTARSIIAEAGLPVAVKPRRSYTLSELFARGKVAITASEAALAAALASAQDGTHLFEGYFAGEGAGVSVLAKNGIILQAFEHHRVHEKNGAGYYRVSAELSAPLAEAARKLVEAVSYTGIAMFEFKLNRGTGAWILLEVNARPWGSMPLPVGLGIDFPYRWYQLLVEERETPAVAYRTGVYARNFVRDGWQRFCEARALRGNPLKAAQLLLGHGFEYRRLLSGREFHDTFALDDPRPWFDEIAGLAVLGSRTLGRRLPGLSHYLRKRDQAVFRAAVRRAGDKGFNLVFVCQGNICRSPYAAMSLARRLGGEARHIRIDSAGLLARADTASPVLALQAAKEAGLDLRSHRSAHLSKEMAEGASMLVIFDARNLRHLSERYPKLSVPVVWLGSFAAGSSKTKEIADPDGGDIATFRRIYAEIEAGVGGLAAAICEAEKLEGAVPAAGRS